MELIHNYDEDKREQFINFALFIFSIIVFCIIVLWSFKCLNTYMTKINNKVEQHKFDQQ